MRRVAALAATGLVILLHTVLAAAPAQAATAEVMMANYAFSPATLTVHVGDTVTWMQHDQAPHDATTTSAPVSFHSPQLSDGQSWSYTFRTPGTYAYYCSVHPDMRASVTVLPAATTAPPPPKVTSAPAAQNPPKQQSVTTKPATSAAPASTSSAAAAPASTGSSAAPPPAAPQQQQLASATAPTLDPMLLVAGLVTGIAVLCLLLLGSRRAS